MDYSKVDTPTLQEMGRLAAYEVSQNFIEKALPSDTKLWAEKLAAIRREQQRRRDGI